MDGIIQSWGRILTGYTPSLSIEITRECPLRCPGCYAYGDQHLGGAFTLREVSDFRGEALINGVLDLVERHRPLHVSIVGGEPLVRFRELDVLLPLLAEKGLHVQVVTSAVRPIPVEWSRIPRLSIVVSIDGLQPEHDARRTPATYDRILKHIVGHRIVVHCTVTRQQVQRSGYLREFARFWSDQPHVRKIWFSLYTPQIGEVAPEILAPEDRRIVVEELFAIRTEFPKVEMPKGMIEVYTQPPASPDECIFSRVTHSVSADLRTRITPCQFGGKPDCSQCGCIASAGLAAIGRHRLFGLVPIDPIFNASIKLGQIMRRRRERRDRRARQLAERAA
ncbi:MAG TPA: radical SAM protein [Vicinamibacterales bacterium]|nr:radical SAM protein [Vicinamibacterales bacterium]